MQSGTLLHLALLRKTSNAQKRKKELSIKKKNSYILQNDNLPEENYVLSGWSTEQNQIRAQLQGFKLKNNIVRLDKLRQSFQQNKTKISTSRTNIKTSQLGQRPKNRCQSFRNYQHHRSVNHTKIQYKQNESLLRQITSQIYMKQQKKYHKINLTYNQPNNKSEILGCKQNQSAPQILHPNQKGKINKIKLNKPQNNDEPQLFTYLHFNNIRARKFFKP